MDTNDQIQIEEIEDTNSTHQQHPSEEKESPIPFSQEKLKYEYGAEHLYNKYIHIKDYVNNLMRNMFFTLPQTPHLLLMVMEQVQTIPEELSTKRYLALHIIEKLISKYHLCLSTESEQLKQSYDSMYTIFYDLHLEKHTKIATKKRKRTEEPFNVITYTLFEQYEKNDNITDLIGLSKHLLDDVDHLYHLNKNDKKFIVLKVVQMLVKEHNLPTLGQQLLPAFIDAVNDIKQNQYYLQSVKKGKSSGCCTQ